MKINKTQTNDLTFRQWQVKQDTLELVNKPLKFAIQSLDPKVNLSSVSPDVKQLIYEDRASDALIRQLGEQLNIYMKGEDNFKMSCHVSTTTGRHNAQIIDIETRDYKTPKKIREVIIDGVKNAAENMGIKLDLQNT